MVTLAEAKAHVRVDHPDDDATIQAMVEAASDHLASIGVDMTADPRPPAIRHCILLLVGHLYDNRHEAPTAATADRLAAPYREVVL